MYDVYVSLGRYDFIVKVIKNGRREVKNSLVQKWRMSRVPGRRNQILSSTTPMSCSLV